MKIIDKREHVGTTPLEDVHVGCGFLYRNTPCLKLSEEDEDDMCMVFDLDSSVVARLGDRTMVVPCCMELHLVD